MTRLYTVTLLKLTCRVHYARCPAGWSTSWNQDCWEKYQQPFRGVVTMTLYLRQQKRHNVKDSLLDSVGEGEGGMIWDGSIETCILSYVKWIAGPGSMHETRCSGLVHWDDPVGWDGEGGRRGVQDGEHMCSCGWLMSMFGKNHYNIVK